MLSPELGNGTVSRNVRGYVLRGTVLAVVFGAGFLGFVSGVELSGRAGVPDAGVATQLYYTIGLFVLGGLDLGMPVGGPVWGQWLLWFAYFAAPVITASAVIEGVVKVLAPERWRLRNLRDHVVVGGGGRLAMLYLQRLRANGRRSHVVVVEANPDHPYREVARRHRAHWVVGDITNDATLASLRVERARRVLLLTGDDFANLDAASKILARAPQLRGRIGVHVADLRFAHLMSTTTVARDAEVFNIYEAAAIQLVETELVPYFEGTDFRDLVVVAGFGRLGQTIVGELQRRAPDSMDAVIIIDTDIDERVLAFEEQVGFADGFERHTVRGDAGDLAVWQRVEGLYDFSARAPAFLIVSGNDALNLRVALRLSQRYPDARILARRYFRSSFADELSEDAGFSTFSVAELIRDSLPDPWF